MPPTSCHHSDPASHGINSILVSHVLRTLIIASTSSGPVPSPRITVAVFFAKWNQLTGKILSIYMYLEIASKLITRLLVNGDIFVGGRVILGSVRSVNSKYSK